MITEETQINRRLGEDGPGITLTLDFLTVALLISSVLYVFCLVLASRKLAFLNRVSPELGTKKLLVLSVAVVSGLRVMSFAGVMAMDIANVRAHYSLRPMDEVGRSGNGVPADRNQKFYDAAMLIMFDLPNCVVVSTFVLLTLVWAECFLQSRFHTESTIKWKKRWLKGYMFFNAALYGTQIVLYLLVICPTTAGVVRTVLYAFSTGINFAAVLLVLATYVYLNVSFSGYPYRSIHLRESLQKISNVMALWCLSRLVWGSSMLVIYVENVELLQDSLTPVLSAVVLLLLFLLCEISPIVILLDYSYMQMVGFESGASRDMNALASRMNPIAYPAEEVVGMEGGGEGEDCFVDSLLNMWQPSAGDLYGLYAPHSDDGGPLLGG